MFNLIQNNFVIYCIVYYIIYTSFVTNKDANDSNNTTYKHIYINFASYLHKQVCMFCFCFCFNIDLNRFTN